MLNFSTSPPQGPEDVEWAPGATDLIINARNEDAPLLVLEKYGEAIGVILMSALAKPSVELVEDVVAKLRTELPMGSQEPLAIFMGARLGAMYADNAMRGSSNLKD